MAVFVTVASGFSTSSAACLFPTDRRWALDVPSMSPVAVRVEFSATSGGGADFGPLHVRPDLPDVVNSGTPRPAWAEFIPPTPFVRVKLGANTTDTASFTLFPVALR